MSTPSNRPPLPDKLPGPGIARYNLADVMAHIHGYEYAAARLRQFITSELVRPTVGQKQVDFFFSEAARMEAIHATLSAAVPESPLA